MKNILKSLAIIGVGAVVFTSCSDFLDQTSPSELNNLYSTSLK